MALRSLLTLTLTWQRYYSGFFVPSQTTDLHVSTFNGVSLHTLFPKVKHTKVVKSGLSDRDIYHCWKMLYWQIEFYSICNLQHIAYLKRSTFYSLTHSPQVSVAALATSWAASTGSRPSLGDRWAASCGSYTCSPV